jgi:hypothetical protein
MTYAIFCCSFVVAPKEQIPALPQYSLAADRHKKKRPREDATLRRHEEGLVNTINVAFFFLYAI